MEIRRPNYNKQIIHIFLEFASRILFSGASWSTGQIHPRGLQEKSKLNDFKLKVMDNIPFRVLPLIMHMLCNINFPSFLAV